ncbi:hypothetical protein EDD21DRAFT_353662 [Dissophora ornata]|nr:hypothetical protein EDD21DRAFT_353662 [Dissophora ornata]
MTFQHSATLMKCGDDLVEHGMLRYFDVHPSRPDFCLLARGSHNWFPTEPSSPQDVESVSAVGNHRGSLKVHDTPSSCVVVVTTELEKRLQEHQELLHRQQEQNEEQKQGLQELKNVLEEQSIQTCDQLKEQQQFYQTRISKQLKEQSMQMQRQLMEQQQA